ncbi:MAG: nicotinate-nicotinamide nucleotide adenylyltransferase, partial [Candidatus Eremiobacteraeota bacterium]|nr:nicotinate-nicotinamide nucleotide adenylyltransferase [Candidatus Eremiobacteraeota bacterium]
TERLERYLKENPPRLEKFAKAPGEKRLADFLEKQERAKQYLDLPRSWAEAWELEPGEKLVTSQGVIVAGEGRRGPRLYFHASRELAELYPSGPPALVRVARGKLRVGFFTGTFDPPHEGHKKLLLDAIRQFDLDKIYILPTPTPDHKANATAYAPRRDMARAFFADDPRIVVADDDFARVAEERGIGGLQRHVARLHAKDQVYQIMGADALERVLANREISFPKNFSLVVGERAGSANKFPAHTRDGNPILALETSDEHGLSSTKIREAIAQGKRPPGISEEVYRIIRREGLYGAANAKGSGAGCGPAFSKLGY